MHPDLKKHIKATAAYEVEQICKPLFNHFDITTFVCSRIFKNRHFWTLSNKADWVEYFYLQQYSNPPVFENKIAAGFYLDLDALNIPYAQLNAAREYFNAEYWMNIIKDYDDYYEIYGFATFRNNTQILNTYINHRDIFEHFILHFKEQADYIIQHADKNSILLPNQQPLASKPTLVVNNGMLNKKELFYAETSLTKFSIQTNNGEITLTKRQFECLDMLAQGKKLKEIGNNFSLSPRTIEKHIENIKLKAGYFTRSQLIDSFRASNSIALK